MKNVSLDLSVTVEEGVFDYKPQDFDYKGWTFYTKEGTAVTQLESDGYGGFLGVELGQTFYYSRVLSEDLDNPVLQLDSGNRNFAVWLDDALIYSDCPELDNRIGHLTLPTYDWERIEPIFISLPPDYQNKTLTIAQSFPEYTETSRIVAWPAAIKLYCGYTYESGLISETFRTAIIAASAFLLGMILLISYVSSHDNSLLFLSIVAFLWMTSHLINTSFFYQYFGQVTNSWTVLLPFLSADAILFFLALRGGRKRKMVCSIVLANILLLALYAIFIISTPTFTAGSTSVDVILSRLLSWFGLITLICILIMSTLFWKKDNWFWKIFTIAIYPGLILYWLSLALFFESDVIGTQLLFSLQSGSMDYIYMRFLPPIVIIALTTASIEAILQVFNRRTEQRLIQEKQDLLLESYENLLQQHKEVMILRHDMVKHFHVLREFNDNQQIKSYLNELIGQNEMIRPVVQSGNEILDIVLNSKINSARHSNVAVNVIRAEASATLPFSEADLGSVVMNIMDNALTAAINSDAVQPYIELDAHVKGNFFILSCKNSAQNNDTTLNDTSHGLPEHGYGLQIIQNIVDKYQGLVDIEFCDHYFKIVIAVPIQ